MLNVFDDILNDKICYNCIIVFLQCIHPSYVASMPAGRIQYVHWSTKSISIMLVANVQIPNGIIPSENEIKNLVSVYSDQRNAW